MSEVRYGLLGPFAVRADDEQFVITGPAERALLAILLLSPGARSRRPR
jgi:DNA-binding SARP family transcriptional activator